MNLNSDPSVDDFHEQLQCLLSAQSQDAALSILFDKYAVNGVGGIALLASDENCRDRSPVTLVFAQDISGQVAPDLPRQIAELAIDRSPKWLSTWLFRRKHPTSLYRISRYVPFTSGLVQRIVSPPDVPPLEDLMFVPYRHHSSKYLMVIGLYKPASDALFNQLTTFTLAYLVKWDKEEHRSAILPREQLSISETELECLRWMAAGKTLQEISIITGMSYGNVRYHLNKARDRSGYATMQQLLVHAAHEYRIHPLRF
ncbi:hypothetical protein JCM17960_10060 [Magnetospira thiophila]